MKRILTLLAIPTLALTLAACTTDTTAEEPAEEVTVTEEEPLDEEETVTEEQTETALPNNVLPFGDTYTWDNGLQVTIQQPQPWDTTDSYWAEEYPDWHGILVTVDVTNGTTETIPTHEFNVAITSDNQNGEWVIGDGEADTAYTDMLPGSNFQYNQAFMVPNPDDLQIAWQWFDPNFDEHKVIYINE